MPSRSPRPLFWPALGTRLVVLVGMMGAGQFTIGRRLAARLHLPFLDADIEIEAAAGMVHGDFHHGEPHFQIDGEARVIARLLESGPAALATGGGSFMREETRRRVSDKAISIWPQGLTPKSSCAASSAGRTVRCCRPPTPPPPSGG